MSLSSAPPFLFLILFVVVKLEKLNTWFLIPESNLWRLERIWSAGYHPWTTWRLPEIVSVAYDFQGEQNPKTNTVHYYFQGVPPSHQRSWLSHYEQPSLSASSSHPGSLNEHTVMFILSWMKVQNMLADIISRSFYNPHLQQLTETESCVTNDNVCYQMQLWILLVQQQQQCLTWKWRICKMIMKRRLQLCMKFWVHISYRWWVHWLTFSNIGILLNQSNSAKCLFFCCTTTSSGYYGCPWSQSDEYWMPFLCSSLLAWQVCVIIDSSSSWVWRVLWGLYTPRVISYGLHMDWVDSNPQSMDSVEQSTWNSSYGFHAPVHMESLGI